MSKTLTVYKASAGSGKTFTLATHYIKLLVENPMQYRNILAVTFTNKATEEMKMRILSQLYGIWHQYPDSKSYTDKLTEELGCDVEYLRKQVKTALHLLIHNYSFFRVETIDSFFQSVLRNLARELDLTANLRIELNDREVEGLAVDKMIEDLAINDDVMQWIMDYIYDNMQEDKGWNVIGQIKSFGLTIFKDFYKENDKALVKAMEDSTFFEHYVKTLKEERNQAKKVMQDIAEEFFNTIGEAGVSVDDFSFGKAGVCSLFLNIKEGPAGPDKTFKRANDAIDKPDKWVSAKNPLKPTIIALVKSKLNTMLEEALSQNNGQWRRYQSATLTLRHLYKLRLLNVIEKSVRLMNDEAGRFLLSDTQHLLHSLISDNDSPFVFEKIGSRLEHIMIDEFQDTSVVQWKNFKVLLQECMSHAGSKNLIVGDVKQSIYRWRAGDWRLLNDIENEFPNHSETVKVENLDINFRSQANVINFNNHFFSTAAEMEKKAKEKKSAVSAQQLQRAYSDVSQKWKKNEINGLVTVKLFPSNDYQLRTLEEVAANVRLLLNRGARQSDIAILVRVNASIPLVADYFAEHCPEVRIVSDEAFRLGSSIAIRIVVLAMYLLTHPDDVLSTHSLAALYQQHVLKANADLNSIFIDNANVSSLLPEDFLNNREKLLLMPLYDLAKELLQVFSVNDIEGQTGYICAFLDELNRFTTDTTTDIDTFVDEWNTSLCNKNIRGDEVDGVRILSIHKSKGLEYNNVIVPFCDWVLERSNVIWCQPKEEPYNQLPLVPVDYSSNALLGTVFENDYITENLQNTVDNLNLLYVAFTRAGHNLFVYGRRKTASTRSTLIEKCLPLVTKDLPGASLNGVEDEKEAICFSFGKLYIPETLSEGKSQNVLLAKAEPLDVYYSQHQCRAEFKQSNKSMEFVGNDGDEHGYIKIGSIMHNVFSRIKTSDDINNAVDEIETEGLLDTIEKSKSEILKIFHKRLQDPRVAEWFSPANKVYNECTILTYDPKNNKVTECRPDRVVANGDTITVIDFKFGTQKQEYIFQVRDYMKQLHAMGHANVKGYLWFVYNNIIEEVTL